MEKKLFDITVPTSSGMLHWPGDPEVEISRISSISEGATANVSVINFGLHTGTHMDAPLHFIDKSTDITGISPEIMIGKCTVIRIDNPQFIGAGDLAEKKINTQRVLFRTKNSDSEWFNHPFNKSYVFLKPDAASVLIKKGVKLVGIDYLSIGEFKNGKETHQILLGNGVWVIEGLYMKDIPEGEYEIFALPLKVKGADGAPARVLLKIP